MGEVLLGATLGLEGAERPVIVKMIRSEHRADASFKARFLDEARVQAQLGHSGIAQVIEATTDEATGEPYVAVEYVDGRSLGDLRQRALSQGDKLAWHEAVALAAMAAEALAHMHDRKDSTGRPLAIVHRDLSPQNIMLSYGGELKVIDFGTARGLNRRCHTVAGVVFAKPGYVAPEVANGDPGDYRVDLYALGVMLWELLRGTRFLQGDAQEHMGLVAKREKELPAIAETAGAPLDLDAIIVRLTTFDRDKRYAETRLAARDLAALLGSAPPLPNGERGIRARCASVMDRFFAGESMRARREFTKLVAAARKTLAPQQTPRVDPSDVVRKESEIANGMLVGTRYKLLRQLGQGEGGVVHEAEHVDLGRRVAIKITKGGANEKDAMTRLRREARALARVRSEGVVNLIDVGKTTDDRAFAVMELCDGESLAAFLKKRGTVSEAESLEIVRKALVVLEDIHAVGVVHRDLKPENLFVTRAGALKILDFGIALVPADACDAKTPKPEGGLEIFGTPDYMAPEQATGRADCRSDIYALGTFLYELLAGRLPFVTKGVAPLLEAKAQGNPPAIGTIAPSREVSAEAEAIALRALARHPNLRFQTATEMRTAIEALLAAPDRARRRRRVKFVGAAALVVVAGVTFVYADRANVLPHAKDAFAGIEARAASWLHHGKSTDAPPADVANADPTSAEADDDTDVALSAASDVASASPPSADSATPSAQVAKEDPPVDASASAADDGTTPPHEKPHAHTAQRKKHKGKAKHGG